MEKPTQTFGDKRIRVNFNPMGTDKIMFKKKEFAHLIDELESLKNETNDSEN